METRVLIVDDSEASRILLAAILDKAGCESLQAADGREALAAAERERPDLILLDVNLPGMDGFQVCAQLKSRPALAEIPVIFVSARDEAADKVRGLELGGVDYVAKPFDKAEVLARVKSQLKIRNLTRELLRKNEELVGKQARLEEDLRAAAAIQASLLPPRIAGLPSLDLAWDFIPCQELGGDLFHASLLDGQRLCLYMLDVSGHGVPSSLVTVALHEILLPHGGVTVREGDCPGDARELVAPAEVLREVDRQFPVERFDKCTTMVYALLDLVTGELTYANAGHPPPLLLRAGGGLERLEPTGPLIGTGGLLPYAQASLALRPGDRLVLYTDGIPEYEGREGGQFGLERLGEALAASRGESLAGTFLALRESLATFGRGAAPQDDMSLLGVELRG